jgi:uncharacterized membrane protein
MRHLLLTLHLIAAVFLIGPLVAAANQAASALRKGDAGGLRTLARIVTIYGWCSLLVLVFGAGLVQDKYHYSWGDAWLLISLVLFLLASALMIGLLGPLLRRAVTTIGAGGKVPDLAGRAGMLGGLASLCYLVIVVLMVYKPGN